MAVAYSIVKTRFLRYHVSMSFEVIGHSKQISYLKRIIEVGAIPNVLLFVGPPHVGKRAVAHWMAAEILHASFETIETHPRIVRLAVEENNVPKNVRLEDMRALGQLSAVQHSEPLIMIVEHAGVVRTDAWNALLKFLEEPNASIYFIILSRAENEVPITVRSRAAMMRFAPVASTELYNGLRNLGISEKEIIPALELAAGRPGIALQFIGNATYRDNIQRERELWKTISTGAVAAADKLIQEMAAAKKDDHQKGRRELQIRLELWAEWIAEINPAHQALRIIAETIPYLSENMHPRVLLERILYAIAAQRATL